MALSRRKLISTILRIGATGGIISALYPVLSYLVPPKIAEASVSSIKAGKDADFPVGTSKILKFGRKPVILFKNSNGELKALSASCTHLDCIVQWEKSTEQIWCACHNGRYDQTGRNISGPPPRPLAPFDVKVINEEIIISQVG